MGCIKSKEKKKENTDLPPIGANDAAPKAVDPRLPFETYRQLFQMKNSWKAISRALEPTAKSNLIRFFQNHPQHKALHSNLASLETEEQMQQSTAFENAALAIYNTIDEMMESIDKVDFAIEILRQAGKAHAKLPGFDTEYFKDMEASFLKAAEETLGDRFTEATEQNFRRLYQFVIATMTEGYREVAGTPNKI